MTEKKTTFTIKNPTKIQDKIAESCADGLYTFLTSYVVAGCHCKGDCVIAFNFPFAVLRKSVLKWKTTQRQNHF